MSTSADVADTRAGGTSGPSSFHPSIGVPDQAVTYVPFDASRTLFDAGASTSEQEDETAATLGSVTVTVPPAAVHSIFAHRQWRAGMILADIIASQIAPQLGASEKHDNATTWPLIQLKGKRVLELGAGTALPGILAAHPGAHAEQVVITDYDEETLVARLRANVRANTHAEGAPRRRVAVQGYTWGRDVSDLLDLLPPSASNPAPRFDAVLLADCLWDRLSHADLLSTLSRVLARDRDARAYVASGLHTGREVLVEFIRRARRHGLVLRRWLVAHQWREEQDGVLRARFQPVDEARRDEEPGEDGWEDFILEAQLVLDDEADDPPSGSHQPSEQASAAPPPIIARGPRLNPCVTRSFVLAERPEERKEVGGVQERNKWMTLWSLGWSREALDVQTRS